MTQDWIINVCSSIWMGAEVLRHRDEGRKDHACPTTTFPSTVLYTCPLVVDLGNIASNISAPVMLPTCCTLSCSWLMQELSSISLEMTPAMNHSLSNPVVSFANIFCLDIWSGQTTIITPSSPDHLLAASFSPFFLFRLSVTSSLLVFPVCITFICLIFPFYYISGSILSAVNNTKVIKSRAKGSCWMLGAVLRHECNSGNSDRGGRCWREPNQPKCVACPRALM